MKADPGTIRKPPVVEEPSDSVLHQFLADHDAACPSCGYNLRDLSQDQCPECGQAIKLHLQPAGPMARRGGLLVLVFLWLLAASAVQSWTVGKRIHRQATSPIAQFITTSGNLFSSMPQLNQTIVQLREDIAVLSESPLLSEETFAGMEEAQALREAELAESEVESSEDHGVSDETETTDSNVGVTVTIPAAPMPSQPGRIRGRTGNPNWSFAPPVTISGQTLGGTSRYYWGAVAWQQWTQAGTWLVLGLVALVGFFLLRKAKRAGEPSERLLRSIPILAWSGFGVFCVMHLCTSVFRLL